MLPPSTEGECRKSGCSNPARYDITITRGSNIKQFQSCKIRWHLGVLVSSAFEYVGADEVSVKIAEGSQ